MINTSPLTYTLFTLLILLEIAHFFALPKITDKTVYSESQTQIGRQVLLPDLMHGGEHTASVYALTIDYHPWQQTRFHLYPQGCITAITLNDAAVKFPESQKCNFHDGMLLDFAPFLISGKNVLKIHTDHVGLQVGSVLLDGFGQWNDWLGFALIAAVCGALALSVRHYTHDWLSGCIVCAGLLLYLIYFSHTGFVKHTMDMPGHLEYMTYIADYLRLPKPYERWVYRMSQFYHPPLYYSIGAGILLMSNWLGSFDTVSSVRLFSLACFLSFQIFGILILRRLLSNNLAYYSALLLLIFYPSAIFLATRINSELLFYTFFAGFLYFLLRWLEENNDAYLARVFILMGLALATRSNAVIFFPLLALAALYQWRKRSVCVNSQPRMLWLGVCIIILGIGINFGRTQYYHSTERRNEPFIVGNIYMAPPSLHIENSTAKLLLLDTASYFNEPFWSPWNDRMGRQYFWNSVFKTSLLGEFEWNNPQTANLFAILLLALIAYIGNGVTLHWSKIKHLPHWWMPATVLMSAIIALAANRLINPLSCSQDFRYVYPALIGFCGMQGVITSQHLAEKKHVRAAFGIGLNLIFAGASIVFFMTQ